MTMSRAVPSTASVPFPKPPKRIVDPEAGKRKLALDAKCRICQERASDGHHVLLRSQRGDDLEDNIVPLCRECHRRYHDGKGDIRLSLDEKLYVLTKLGQGAGMAYLERRRYV